MFDLPFGGDRDDGGDDDREDAPETSAKEPLRGERFDPPDAFVPESLPEPGAFLRGEGATVLDGVAHVTVRDTARRLFEERGVRDATFGYVLTKLDRDRNHPDAGFRYAREGDTLRVEFTPTTAFCPQGGALVLAAFRAWNADPSEHEFDLVRVRVSERYHDATTVNERLDEAAETVRRTGTIPAQSGDEPAHNATSRTSEATTDVAGDPDPGGADP